MAEDAELIGGISVSIGASDQKLVSDLERAEQLVQAFVKEQRTIVLRARVQTTGAAGGAGAAPLSQADVQRMASSALIAVARSPQLPALIARIDRLRPPAQRVAEQQPLAPQRQRRDEPVPVTFRGAALPTSKPGQQEDPLLKSINAELAKNGEFLDHLGGEVQKLPSATAKEQRAPRAQAAARPVAEAEAKVEVPAANIDTSALATQLNQIVATFSSFNERLATAFAAMPSAGHPEAGQAPAPVPAPKRVRQARSTKAVATATAKSPVQAAEETAGEESETAGLVKYSRRGAPILELPPAEGTALGVPISQGRPRRSVEIAAARARAQSAREAEQRSLTELSYEAEQAAGNAPASATLVGAHRTPAQIEAFRREEAARSNALASQPPRVVRPPASPVTTAEPEPDAIERERRRRLAALESRGRGGVGRAPTGLDSEDIARREGQRVATSEAQRFGQGRTPRTTAASLGGSFLFGGPTRQTIEATAAQTAAEQKLLVARRNLNRPEVIRDANAYRKATEEVAVAEKDVATASARVQQLATGGTALRSLAAVTVAGAAFSVGLEAISTAFKAIETAAAPTIQRLTGFSQLTADYTSNLADATRAANGNAQAVTAVKLASTGLAASTAATIQPLIQQRATVEAGNKALQDQIDSLHVFENLRRSNQQAGITSTTGGLLGTPINGIPGVAEQIGNLLAQQGQGTNGPTQVGQVPLAPNGLPAARGGRFDTTGGRGASQADVERTLAAQKDFASALELVNGQLEKGGDSAAHLAQSLDKTDPRIEQTAKAFDAISPAMAAAIRNNRLYSAGIQNTNDALKALQAINIAGTLPDPALLAEQFNRADQAMVRALGRTTQFALKTQLPAQAALQNLAQPLLPVGTGIPGGAQTPGQQKAIDLQKQLNAYYVQGQQELINTYKPQIVQNFGAAAGVAFQQQINGIAALGKEIAGLQADIANTSAAQQTKEYNYQLFIARRTLSDIGGLTGRNFGAGQSYLGVLEKQNLALSRQGQQLQFNLSQRQINFQQALAGFQAPGVTPEERQARIQEAKIEAGFAQKQLDIQRQMFGNQVQIVDIQNLREGADLAKQIGLLISGRRAAIRIAVDQQELILAQKRSEQLTQQAGKYLSAVDTIAAAGISHIQDLETASGKAMTRLETQAVKLFGNFVVSLNAEISRIAPNINPYGGVGNVPYGPPTHGRGAMYQQQMHAMGAMYHQQVKMNAIGSVSQPTMVSPGNVAGEAGTETVAILRNVRPYNPSAGGGTMIVNFNGGIVVRQDSDIDEIARKVERVMGRKASQIGLRSVG